MRFRVAVRVFLAILAASAAIAIGWSLFSRGGDARPEAGDLLDPGIARESTDFEHVEYKLGRPVFRVQSKIDTLTDVGEHRLRDVRLTVYGPEGDATDWISGQNATYRVEAKRIVFEDEVEAGLSDGTLLFSQRLEGDLAAETLSIERDFRFRRGEVEGSGRALLYEIGSKQLRIGADFRMESPDAEAPFSLSAGRGEYDLAGARLSLRDDVRLSGDDYRLTGGEMRIELTPERRVERIDDIGEARFVSGEKSFAGRRILLAFDTGTGRLGQFQVFGSDEASGTRAVFEQKTARGRHRLQADRIVGVPNPRDPSPGRFQLETFEAVGRARFASPELGIDPAASGRMVGAFDGRGSLRQMDLLEGVTVDRQLGGRRERLKSRRLRLVFDQNQRMQRSLAYTEADVTLSEAGWSRRLTARESLVMDFREGLISRLTASGGCLVETVEGEARSEVRAPSMLALFSDGLVDRLFAGDGVSVETRRGAVRQRTESRQLRLIYRDGKLARAIQTGDFHYTEAGPGRRVELESEEAAFRPEDDRIVAVGSEPRPRLVQTSVDESGVESVYETGADRFHIAREGGAAEADGDVSSRRVGEGSFSVSSGRMSADPETGVIVYSVSPRLVEGDSYISGRRMTLREADQTLVAERDVDSFFSGVQGDKLATCRIAAERARIRAPENKVFYEGEVRVRCDQMSLDAPFLELRFGEGGFDELEEAFAWGGVRISDASRKAVGDKAYYRPLEKKVTVLGDRAEVVDANQGKATGAELTFFLGDERIVIEGPAKRRP